MFQVSAFVQGSTVYFTKGRERTSKATEKSEEKVCYIYMKKMFT